MQNRWSSYSVIVLPGQCLYTSPGTKSSRWRPKGRSCVVIAPDPRSATRRSTSRSGPFRAIPCRKGTVGNLARSEEHTSELQSLMRISYAVFCLQKKTKNKQIHNTRELTDGTHLTT